MTVNFLYVFLQIDIEFTAKDDDDDEEEADEDEEPPQVDCLQLQQPLKDAAKNRRRGRTK